MNAAFVNTGLTLDNSKINLNEANVINETEITFNEDGSVANGLNKWVKVEQDVQEGDQTISKTYYYYIGNVQPGGFTDNILDSVTLNSTVAADPNYLNQTFNVDIDAYSVQSTAEAVTDSDKGHDKGATGDQKGFGLSETDHQNLVKALQAVAKGDAGTCETNYGTSATLNASTTN